MKANYVVSTNILSAASPLCQGNNRFVLGSLGLRDERIQQDGGVIFSNSPLSVSGFQLQEAVVVDDTTQYAGYSVAYGSVLGTGNKGEWRV